MKEGKIKNYEKKMVKTSYTSKKEESKVLLYLKDQIKIKKDEFLQIKQKLKKLEEIEKNNPNKDNNETEE